MRKHVLAVLTFMLAGRVSLVSAGGATLTPMEELGNLLYFDVALSEPSGQSCASCHEPSVGSDDPDSDLPVSEGVVPGLFGGRNAPISAYAMYAPALYFDEDEGLWIGGQFWDGRATGDVLGDPLADQAVGPFLNPVEMANTSKAQVIAGIAASDYAGLFEQVWGPGSLGEIDAAYDRVGLSIAAFERTQLFGQFSSKYDYYLADCLAEGGGITANGNFKVMTLRNIGLSSPYAHNGQFESLKEIVHFYNTRDVPGAGGMGMDWPASEYPATVNFDELGNLGLSDADEDDLVDFMMTLGDDYRP